MSFRGKSSGRIVKAKRSSKLTVHQRNHRWESFSTKISKLHSLDPLRRVRRHDLDAEDLSATTSYLRNGLDKWAELNISKQYAAFRREINPLTESLPQILHFEDRIMGLFETHIARQEKDALEPLLDLLTAFAHDLGVRFEKHYPTALRLVVGVASRPQDVEVIEWTFAALAFLFKYLARLLVPDIRPTYDAVAPLMGKAKNPGHIARFAAEAMSFLVKKAAAPSHRDKALPLLIEHARKDLESVAGTKQYELYSQGIMTMFAEALKAPGNGVHSTGADTITALIRVIPDEEVEPKTGPFDTETIWTNVCTGVLTSIIHHSTSETFAPIETAILEEAMAAVEHKNMAGNPGRMTVFFRLLGTMAGVRKGTRIQEWSKLIKASCSVLGTFEKNREEVEKMTSSFIWEHVIVNTAISWDIAPMDALIPSISSLTNNLTREPLSRWYIPFCSYFADLNPNRFRSLFQKEFLRFIVAHWSEDKNEELLCVLLPRMVEAGGLPSPDEKETCPLPQTWQDEIINKFARLEDSPFPERGIYGKDPETWRDKCLPKYSSLLQVVESTSVQPSTQARIAEVLLKKLKLALRPSETAPTDEEKFIVSIGFKAYLRMSTAAGSVDLSLSPLLKDKAPRFRHSVGFLEALLDYQKELSCSKEAAPQETGGTQSPNAREDQLVSSLISNLSSASSNLRLVSLQLLEALDTTPDQSSALATMLQLERTPFDLQNSRGIAVHLRRLGQVYANPPAESWLLHAIPAYLFGMLTVPLSPIWDEAVEAMKTIAQSKAGEEAVANLAFSWLEEPSSRDTSVAKPFGTTHPPLTDFECLNFMRLSKTAQETGQILEDPFQNMLQAFKQQLETVPDPPEKARGKALKVLGALPGTAEKRSRILVPYLLGLGDGGESPAYCPAYSSEDEQALPYGSWSLADKKYLLKIFTQFVNPRVLYQSQHVYDVLLQLLANGDIEIQKSALKAILAWKQDGVKPYQEHFEYLLDEARFKNELTVLFQGDHKILPDHQAEAMPILLRILYGRSISKKGVTSGRHGQQAIRLAVIRNLSVEDMGSFLDIALGELRSIRVVDASGIQEDVFARNILPVRKQVGLLNMIESIINELGTAVLPYMEKLVNSVLYCLISACRNLQDTTEDAEEVETASNTSLYRVVRTTALKALCKLFQNAQTFDWTPYQDAIVAEIISPRIEKLPVETTQGVSAIWKLMSTWSVLPRAALLLAIDKRIVSKIAETLGVKKTKDEVKTFALNIIRNVIKLAQAPAAESEFNELIKSELLDSNIDLILKEIGSLLKDSGEIGRDLLSTAVETVVELAPFVEKSANAEELVGITSFLLNQPSRKVAPKIKGSLLLILKRFISLGISQDTHLKTTVFATISSLFSFFKDRVNRQVLADILQVFAELDPALQEVATICQDLNAYHERRLDEPDYDRRMKAFNSVSRERSVPFTIDQWMPLLHSFKFFLHHNADQDFGVLSTNAADGLNKFIDEAARLNGPQQGEFVDVLSSIVLPAIQSGARESSETARRESLRVFGHLVSRLPDWPPVADLVPLAPKAEDTEESFSFFFHLLSPAASRQLQALKLLEKASDQAEFSATNISQFFIPLLEHFIWDRPEDGGDDRGLGFRATEVIAKLTASLEWQQYRAILRRFILYVESKPELHKQVIRLLEMVVDTLRSAISDKAAAKATDLMEVDEGAAPVQMRRLASTAPDQEKVADEITNNLLPTLLKHLHEKDENTVSQRVPVGVIIFKLLNLLPEERAGTQLTGPLIDICHMLRSKTWETREQARDTLARIALILGEGTFGFLLNELCNALTKGYQLHVLSYTVHSILLKVIPQFKRGALDYCLPKIVRVIMDDVFGAVGQEKDSEGYVSSMKEVKSSKSQDSMELITKSASIIHLCDLTQPLQAMLMEKLDIRTVRKVDDLLTRIASGLLQNPAAESRDTLVFCYEVIQEVYKKRGPEVEKQLPLHLKKYLVQKGAKKSGERETTNRYTFKLIRFALDVLRAIWRKHDSLRTAANIMGFLPILGDAVVSADEEVKIAAMKILVVLVKVPFKSGESAGLYKVASREAIKEVSQSLGTASDMAQSALKLISVILRDRREIEVKDHAIDMLLGKLKDDLTEPQYRHVTFNFLRAILDRKIETAAVYDILDYVGTVMITNDDKDTRGLARGAFFQFLREYPQKKHRWDKQLNFIVSNLKYDRESGRLSVMEVIHALLSKTADDYVQEVAATCFIPLVFVIVNDDSENCRMAAGELVKQIFKVADDERMKNFLTLLRKWIGEEQNLSVLKLAIKSWGFYFEAREANDKDKKGLKVLLKKCTDILNDEHRREDWELADATLTTVQMLVGKHPEVLSKDSEQLWAGVRQCLSHSRTEVQLTAIKLLSMYLADFAANKGREGSHGLQLGQEEIQELVRLALGILTAPEVEEPLAEEVVRVLVFLGGYLDTTVKQPKHTDEEVEDGDGDDKDGQGEEDADGPKDERTAAANEAEELDNTSTLRTDLRYLLRRLSQIIRREMPSVRPESLVPKLAAMDTLTTLCATSPPETITASLPFVLAPLRNLTDPSIPAPFSHNEVFTSRYDSLKTKAQTLLDKLQARLGNAAYTAAMLVAGRSVRDRRMRRSTKRKIEAVADPERWGQAKRKKFEKKKVKRTENAKKMRDARKAWAGGRG